MVYVTNICPCAAFRSVSRLGDMGSQSAGGERQRGHAAGWRLARSSTGNAHLSAPNKHTWIHLCLSDSSCSFPVTLQQLQVLVWICIWSGSSSWVKTMTQWKHKLMMMNDCSLLVKDIKSYFPSLVKLPVLNCVINHAVFQQMFLQLEWEQQSFWTWLHLVLWQI